MKSNHLRIISELRQNARESLTNISKKLRIPVSTLFDILKAKEKHGILKHTSLVDFKKLGYNVRVSLAIKVKKELRGKLSRFLQNHPSINNLHIINGGFDFMAEAVFKDLREFHDFSTDLGDLYDVEMKYPHIIEDLKREEFLGNSLLIDA